MAIPSQLRPDHPHRRGLVGQPSSTARGQAHRSRASSPPDLGPGRGGRRARPTPAGTGTSPCATPTSQVRCCMWKRDAVARRQAAGGRHRGLRPRRGRGSTRPRASSSSTSRGCFPPPPRPGAAGARAGARRCCSRTASSTRRASGRCPGMRRHARRGDQPRRRGAARHRHRRPASRWPGVRLLRGRRAGPGRRARCTSWCARSGWSTGSPASTLCIVGRGGGGREDLAAFNAEAVCRALAAVRVPDHLRGGPRDRHLAHRPRRRRARRHALRRGRAGRRRPARGAPRSSTISARGWPAASPAGPGSAPSGSSAHGRPAAGRAWTAGSSARAAPARAARGAARRAEPAPRARARLRRADVARRPRAQAPGRSSRPASRFRLRVADGGVAARVEP